MFLLQPSSSSRHILAEVLAILFFSLGIVEDVSDLLGGVCELKLDFLDHPQQHLGWLGWDTALLKPLKRIGVEEYFIEHEGDRVQPPECQ
jgi:hypothetical protein